MSRPRAASRYITIEFPVFSDFIIHFEVARDFKKAIKKYPSIEDMSTEEDNEADALTIYDGGQVCFIFVRPNVSTGTLAHESFHAVEHLLKRHGVKVEDETAAYHLGYVVDNAFRFLRKR